MSAPPAEFVVQYTPELIDQASITFRDYQFKRYGPTLIVACIVNAAVLAIGVWSGMKTDALLAFIALVVVIGPTWLLYKYFVAPRLYAASLKQVLPSSARMSIDTESVALVGRENATIPWALVRVVVETDDLFLLIVSPFAFTLIPRTGLPSDVYNILHAKSHSSAA